jgi:hypothetical protein
MYTPEELSQYARLHSLGVWPDSPEKMVKDYTDAMSFVTKRFHANTHKHTVVYQAKLPKDAADVIQRLHTSGQNEDALIMIKQWAEEIKLARLGGANAEKRWNSIPNPKLDPMSESLEYHIVNGISIAESIYRPGSSAHIQLLSEARQNYEAGNIVLDGIDKELFETTDLGKTAEFEGQTVALDLVFESEYHGKKVELNKPMRGGTKKYHVYVMNPSTKKVKMISFGDVHGGLTAKVSDPKARKSFAARHQCHLKNDKTTAGYWACRINRYAHLWGGKTYPGFW